MASKGFLSSRNLKMPIYRFPNSGYYHACKNINDWNCLPCRQIVSKGGNQTDVKNIPRGKEPAWKPIPYLCQNSVLRGNGTYHRKNKHSKSNSKCSDVAVEYF